MLTVSKPLTAANAMAYYERGNYYFEDRGVWKGKLAQHLGIAENTEIDAQTFSRILDGFDPVTGEKLVASAGSKAVEAKDGKVLSSGHRAGFDLTFSAPKSVSLLAMKDPQIEDLFNEAVDEAMKYVESNFAHTRTKSFEDGKAVFTRTKTENLAWAQFNHRTSRAVDPQLHAHCVVMNMSNNAAEGQTKVLDWDLYSGANSKFVGQFFRSSLAEKLKSVGYSIDVTDRKQGFFKIAGVRDEVEDAFSKRSEEIGKRITELKKLKFRDMSPEVLERWVDSRIDEMYAHLEKDNPKRSKEKFQMIQEFTGKNALVYQGWSDSKLGVEANLESRSKKEKDLTWEDVEKYVDEQCEDLGTSLAEIHKSAVNYSVNKESTPLYESLDDVFEIAMRDTTEMQAGFEKQAFLSHAMKLSLGDYSMQDVFDKFDSCIESGEIVLMEKDPPIYTTRKMIDVEKQVIEYCRTGVNNTNICIESTAAKKFINDTDFDLKLDSSFKKNSEELLKHFDEMLLTSRHSEESVKTFRDCLSADILNAESKNSFKSLYKSADAEMQKDILEFLDKNGLGFTPGQRDAIELIAASKCKYSVIQGDAGTGKSFSMNYARQMLEAEGYIVRGFAPTGKASVELSNSAKIKGCQTIDKFLIDGALKSAVSHEDYQKARTEVDRLIPLLKSGNEQLLKRFRLTTDEVSKMQDYQIEARMVKHDRELKRCLTSPVKDKEVWIVDESGMAGSKKYLNIIEAAERAGAKAVFVGDRKQFASIEAGKMFQELQDKAGIDTVIMPDVMRQKTDQTKEIVAAIGVKDMDFAFDMMRGRKQITENLDNINTFQAGQLIYFHEDIGEDIKAGDSAKVTGVNEDGTISLGIYDADRNEYVDTLFEPEKIAKVITCYESVHQNVITENEDREKRLDLVAKDYLDNTKLQIESGLRSAAEHLKKYGVMPEKDPVKLFDTMVITATNKDRALLNSTIRAALLESDVPLMRVHSSHNFSVLESNSVGGEAKSLVNSYAVGQRVTCQQAQQACGFDGFETEMGTIIDIDSDKNLITVEYKVGEELKTTQFNPAVTTFSAFKETEKPFGINDKIVFLKNDNAVNVRNGQLAIITDIDEAGNVTADLSGEIVSFNLNEYNYIDHAYCLSEYKSQGATVGRLVWHADTEAGNVSSNSFYVAITRCTHEVALYTNNAEALQEKVKQEQFKHSTLGYTFRDDSDAFSSKSNVAKIQSFTFEMGDAHEILNSLEKETPEEFRTFEKEVRNTGIDI